MGANIKSICDLQQSDNVLQTITEEGAAIEDSDVYHSHLRTPVMADGDKVEMYIKVPAATVHTHLVAQFTGELAAKASIRESCTVSASGSALNVLNANRNEGDSSTISVRSSPTLTASGTRLDILDFGGGKKGESGGGAGSEFGWILRYGTIYILRITSAAGSNEGSIRATFRDHAA